MDLLQKGSFRHKLLYFFHIYNQNKFFKISNLTLT